MKKCIKVGILINIAIFILILMQFKSPYVLYQTPYFYEILNSIKNIDVPESYIYSYNKNNVEKYHEIIECSSAFYDKKNKKVELDFRINDLNEIDIFSLVVDNVSAYMKSHSDSYLNDCKIDLTLWSMGTECIIVSNYIRTYDFSINKSINEIAYQFVNCIMKFPGGDKLSSLKNYIWLEVIEFDDTFDVDDINSLDKLTSLNEIRCYVNMFTSEQENSLIKKHKNLRFVLIS